MKPTTMARRIGGLTGVAPRDDRVLPVTRWTARFIIPFLAAAFVVLYGVPGRTTEFFAWTIRPDMTPIVMGAGYGAGVYFFYRVSRATSWHTVAPVFLGITAFTWFMAVATVLHWANFNHGHHAFYLWVFLYAVTPVLIPWLWWHNRRTLPDAPAADSVRLPRSLTRASAGLGGLIVVIAVAMFAVPEAMIGAWPWAVSAFTARILAGWFGLLGVVNAAVALDPRWSAVRILVHSQLLGFGLVLVGVVRAWGNFDVSNPLTWLVVGGMAGYFLGLAGLSLRMEHR